MRWVHSEAEAKGIVFPGDVPGGCIRCLWDDAPEPCRTPTPDPEWGCVKCGFSEKAHPASRYTRGRHTYTPSRCTCGHPIEEARP